MALQIRLLGEPCLELQGMSFATSPAFEAWLAVARRHTAALIGGWTEVGVAMGRQIGALAVAKYLRRRAQRREL